MTRAAGKTPTILCPLDHAPASGSNQSSNTPISTGKFTEQVWEASHGKSVSVCKLQNSQVISSLWGWKSPWIMNGNYTTKTRILWLMWWGLFGLFLAPDPIPDTRLTAIIPAIPTNSEESKSHLLPIQLCHIPLVLVRVHPHSPQQCMQKMTQKEKYCFKEHQNQRCPQKYHQMILKTTLRGLGVIFK